MQTLTDMHNAHLADYMQATHITQEGLAAVLGVSQSWVSERLRKTRRWTLDDLDRLIEAGIPVYLPLYGGLDMEVLA